MQGLMSGGKGDGFRVLGGFYGSHNGADGSTVTITSEIKNTKSKLFYVRLALYSNSMSIDSGVQEKVADVDTVMVYEYTGAAQNAKITISSYYGGGETIIME